MYEISYNENYQKCTFYANSYTEDLIFYLQFQCINAYNIMKQKPSSDGSSVDIQLHVPNIRKLKQWKSDLKTSVVLSFKYQLTIYIFYKKKWNRNARRKPRRYTTLCFISNVCKIIQ